MRLTKASKALVDKHVRVLTAFVTRGGTHFTTNEIVKVDTVWRDQLTVSRPGRGSWVDGSRPGTGTWVHDAGRAPAHYFELAEDPGPPPAKPLPNAPKRHTWVSGLLLIPPSGYVSVDGKVLARVFAAFDGKKVHVSLKVID